MNSYLCELSVTQVCIYHFSCTCMCVHVGMYTIISLLSLPYLSVTLVITALIKRYVLYIHSNL